MCGFTFVNHQLESIGQHVKIHDFHKRDHFKNFSIRDKQIVVNLIEKKSNKLVSNIVESIYSV